MDFGKFKYEQERSEREHKPKKSGGEVKSIRIGFKTGKHDLEVRALQAKKFLERGDMERQRVRSGCRSSGGWLAPS